MDLYRLRDAQVHVIHNCGSFLLAEGLSVDRRKKYPAFNTQQLYDVIFCRDRGSHLCEISFPLSLSYFEIDIDITRQSFHVLRIARLNAKNQHSSFSVLTLVCGMIVFKLHTSVCM